MISSVYQNAFMLLIFASISPLLLATPTTQLIIKPSVCMVKSPGDSCQMTVTVQWQHSEPINACIFQNDTRLNCWKYVNKINTKLDITLEQDMLFTLKNEQQVFATQQVKVNTALPTKYRRRLRADWSFF